MAQDVALLAPREAVLWKQDRTNSRAITGQKVWRGENAPRGTTIAYWLKSVPSGDVNLVIEDPATGGVFRTIETTKLQGLNRIAWDLCSDRRPVQQGQGGFGGGGCGGGGRRGGGGGGGGGQQGPPTVASLAEPGIYRIRLNVGGREYTQTVRVVEDIWRMDR
jgi:hypothetical protein